MSGTTVTGLLVTNNFNFDPATRPYSNAVTTNGQLMIGSTAAPNIRVGNLTSTGGTITITNGPGTINLDLAGGAGAIEKINLQTGTTPITPSGGQITFNGATVAAGTNPVRTNGTGANTMALQVQISQAIASTDATKIVLCNFNSAQFTVDANGFVTSLGAGFVWIDQGTNTTLAINKGYFATAAVTLTLPAAPSQGDTVKIICDTASTVVLTANTGQTIRQGNLASSSAGTFTNSLRGDALELIYRAATTQWIALNGNGTWVAA